MRRVHSEEATSHGCHEDNVARDILFTGNMVAPTTTDSHRVYHVDYWDYDPVNKILKRIHKKVRKATFDPSAAASKDCPVDISRIKSKRITKMITKDTKEPLERKDCDWGDKENANEIMEFFWTGESIFEVYTEGDPIEIQIREERRERERKREREDRT